MDILKLPSPLRRQLLATIGALNLSWRHGLSTQAHSPPHREGAMPVFAEPEPSVPPLLHLTTTTLNSYTISLPPNQAQLRYSASFFQSSPPEFLFSNAYFRTFPPSSFPEVAFLGRSNVGKSSLLNALFGRTKVKDAHVSKRPGKTKTMNGFGITGGLAMGAAPRSGQKAAPWKRFPRGGLIVVDMPGYGSGSREDWGKETLKYLEQRKQLRRTFVLIDVEHGLKLSDITLLMHLRRQGISHQLVLSKADKVLFPTSKPPSSQKLHNGILKIQDLCMDTRQRLDVEAGDGRRNASDILCCSSEKSLDAKHPQRKLGVDEIRWAVLSACGLESDGFGQKIQRRVSSIDVIEDDD